MYDWRSPELNSETPSTAGSSAPHATIKGRFSPYSFVVICLMCDVVVVGATGVTTWLALASLRNESFLPAQWQGNAIAFVIVSHLLWGRMFNLYKVSKILRQSHVLKRLAFSVAAAFASAAIISVAVKNSADYSRLWFFTWFTASISLALLVRLIFLYNVHFLLNSGYCVYKAFSVGIGCDPITPRDISTDSRKEIFATASFKLANMTALAELADKIAQDEIDCLYLCAPWEQIPLIAKQLHLLRHLSTRVFVLPSRSLGVPVSGLSTFGKRPCFKMMDAPLDGWNAWIKRTEDVVLAVLGLMALLPILGVVAIMIRLESPGPVLFRQVRTGFNGKKFEMLKFRSMYVDHTDHHAEQQTKRGDHRVTNVGRFIRRCSLDELPQLVNVVRGEMSIVGPRPHALCTTAEGKNLDELVDYYASRHRVKPGLTGLAQVNGYRGELDSIEKLQRRVDLDLEYIENYSLRLDVMIILKTMGMVFWDPHAY